MAMDLGKQIGPLPLGAWVAVVGGGLGIAWYTRRSEPPVVVDDTSGVPGVGTGPGWTAIPPPTDAPPSSTRDIVTNEEWGRAAVNELVAQGYDPSASDQAVRRYLAAEQLTMMERTLINIALVKLGSPPVPLPPGPALPTMPKPSKPVTPAPSKPVRPRKPAPRKPTPRSPARHRYITVTKFPSRHGTLWGISKTAYGTGALWPRIYNANRSGRRRPDGKMGMISNPNLIQPGWVLLIP